MLELAAIVLAVPQQTVQLAHQVEQILTYTTLKWQPTGTSQTILGVWTSLVEPRYIRQPPLLWV